MHTTVLCVLSCCFYQLAMIDLETDDLLIQLFTIHFEKISKQLTSHRQFLQPAIDKNQQTCITYNESTKSTRETALASSNFRQPDEHFHPLLPKQTTDTYLRLLPTIDTNITKQLMTCGRNINVINFFQ